MLNNCCFTGRLVQDPEIKTTKSGTYVLSFSLAVQRNYKTGEEYNADFLNFVAWRSTAEFIEKHFKKGDMICVEGSLETRNYIDKNNVKRIAYEICVNNAHFV